MTHDRALVQLDYLCPVCRHTLRRPNPVESPANAGILTRCDHEGCGWEGYVIWFYPGPTVPLQTLEVVKGHFARAAGEGSEATENPQPSNIEKPA